MKVKTYCEDCVGDYGCEDCAIRINLTNGLEHMEFYKGLYRARMSRIGKIDI